jgi:hypothetical protein
MIPWSQLANKKLAPVFCHDFATQTYQPNWSNFKTKNQIKSK